MRPVVYTALVLGSGQDGGVPQVGAPDVQPERAASSLALLGSDGGTVLIDSSPDLRRQMRLLRRVPGFGARSVRNAFDSVLLTHAHIGHYAGLVYFGAEAHNASGIACYATSETLEFLRANQPWATLFSAGHLDARPVVPGVEFSPAPDLSVVAHAVPHRHDHSDTVAFEVSVQGGRTLLYVPDIDDWDAWPDVVDIIARADVALLDGTFYDSDEHPERDLASVPHPAVEDTIVRFTPLAGSTRLLLTHLNWTNRLCDPEAPEHRVVASAGFEVASDGMRIPL